MKTGIELIEEERKEQVEKHGFDLEKDAEYYNACELIQAALYALTLERNFYPANWEFWWHDKMMAKKERMSDHEFEIERLKIAGALIAAEIDRLQLMDSPFCPYENEWCIKTGKCHKAQNGEVICQP